MEPESDEVERAVPLTAHEIAILSRALRASLASREGLVPEDEPAVESVLVKLTRAIASPPDRPEGPPRISGMSATSDSSEARTPNLL